MSYRMKENKLCVQVQAIHDHACGIVSKTLTTGVYTNLRHSQISMLLPVVMYQHTHTVHTYYNKMVFRSCVGPRTSDCEGAIKNEEIQQVICVIVMIPQELPYSSQYLLMYSMFFFTIFRLIKSILILIKYACVLGLATSLN